MRIKDTAGTKNREVRLGRILDLDEMEAILARAGEELGLYISHITVLGRRRYPGNRHWHLKQDPKTKGCLDVTYWPGGELMWVSMRNYEPEWVHTEGEKLRKKLEAELAGNN